MRQFLFILTLFAGVIAGTFYLESVDPTGTFGEYPFALEPADAANPAVAENRSESGGEISTQVGVDFDEEMNDGAEVADALVDAEDETVLALAVRDNDQPEPTSTAEALSLPASTSTPAPTSTPTPTLTPILPVQQISRVKPTLTPSPTVAPTDPPPTLTPLATLRSTTDTAEEAAEEAEAGIAPTVAPTEPPLPTPTVTSAPSTSASVAQDDETAGSLSPTPILQNEGEVSAVIVSDNYRGEPIITAVVRAGPSTDYEIIDLVQPGTWLPVSGLTGTGWGTWFYVETPKGRTGWISVQVALPSES